VAVYERLRVQQPQRQRFHAESDSGIHNTALDGDAEFALLRRLTRCFTVVSLLLHAPYCAYRDPTHPL